VVSKLSVVSKLRMRAKNLTFRALNIFSDRKNYPGTLKVTVTNLETVEWVRKTNSKIVAEVGIYEGGTSTEIAKILPKEGELHLFDFADRVSSVASKLEKAGFKNVKQFGCSYKLLDSYNWPLAKLIQTKDLPIYDYVFLDGAHTFAIDALTFFLADRLLKVGGHMDFDDYAWTLGASPTLRPERFPLTARLYTREQIDARQVQMIIELLVRKSGRYQEVKKDKIFRKTG
jgi:predicted O-methyltransferase YrrM